MKSSVEDTGPKFHLAMVWKWKKKNENGIPLENVESLEKIKTLFPLSLLRIFAR